MGLHLDMFAATEHIHGHWVRKYNLLVLKQCLPRELYKQLTHPPSYTNFTVHQGLGTSYALTHMRRLVPCHRSLLDLLLMQDIHPRCAVYYKSSCFEQEHLPWCVSQDWTYFWATLLCTCLFLILVLLVFLFVQTLVSS